MSKFLKKKNSKPQVRNGGIGGWKRKIPSPLHPEKYSPVGSIEQTVYAIEGAKVKIFIIVIFDLCIFL